MIDRIELCDEFIDILKPCTNEVSKEYSTKNKLDFSEGGSPIITFQDATEANLDKLYISKGLLEKLSESSTDDDLRREYNKRLSIYVPIGITAGLMVISMVVLQLLSK